MKKFLLLFACLTFIVACKNDDDTTVAICDIPETIEISNITFESAVISWEDTNIEASFTIEYGESGFVLGSGTIISSTTNTASLTGLAANTEYDVYIKSICSLNNESMYTEVQSFTALAPLVIPQFLPVLSQLNLFSGSLTKLDPTVYAFDYKPNSTLFSDYSHKQRFVVLPLGETMNYQDNGGLLPEFPNNTVIAKSFFYFNDERDETLGKKIIETRVLIKQNGVWQSGDYIWNDSQTEATLDPNGSTVAVNYIDSDGTSQMVNYKIPSNQDCLTCHGNAGNLTPIGLELRALNYNNLLQDLIDNNYLDGLADASTVSTMPDYNDLTETLENRARAYFDINCAHCHSPGGFCEDQSPLRLSYEVPFSDTQILERRFSIDARMQNYNEGFSMPFIGTSMVHTEGYALIQEFLDTL